jgi:O-antigen/teichoic acid export membrane protein
MGCFNLLNYFNNRLKNYKDLAKANVYKSIFNAIVQLIFGFLKAGIVGLISGQIVSQFVANTKLFFNIKKLNLLKSINKIKIIALGIKYKKFFFFDTLVAVTYIFYNRAIIIFLQKYFNSSIVGNYYFAERIVKMPLNFITSSMSNVFFEKISKLSNFEIYKEANLLSFKLFKFTFIPYLIFILSAKFYIPFIFGEKWENLYLYIIYISIPAYIAFLMSPYSYVLKIINKQEVSLLFHILKMIIIFSYFILFYVENFKNFILYFCILDAFIMVIFLNIQIYYLIGKIYIAYIHILIIILGVMSCFVK